MEIQRRRKDFIALLMYLTERKLFFSVNQFSPGLPENGRSEDFNGSRRMYRHLKCATARRGEKPIGAPSAGQTAGKIGVAGSDSHTLSGVGMTFTQVPGSRTVDEYFMGLRAGRGVVQGHMGLT